jgi:myo-inositol-1(or 4)-monophosphatase
MIVEQNKLQKILEVAMTAARLAGEQALKDINSSKVSIKNANELVTQTDSLCQQIIIDHVSRHFINHGFIGEEGADGKLFKQPPQGGEQFWWVIDPIDGTNNFVHHIPSFSISIGVIYEGHPIVGVIFDPNTNSMFTATRHGHAQYNGTKITVSNDLIDEFGSVAIDSNLRGSLPSGIAQIMLRTRFRNMGSTALHLSYVATGGLVGAVMVCPKLWDIAAGALIVERAGGIVTDWDGNKLFPFNLENYDSKPIKTIAANPKVHSEMVQLLKT